MSCWITNYVPIGAMGNIRAQAAARQIKTVPMNQVPIRKAGPLAAPIIFCSRMLQPGEEQYDPGWGLTCGDSPP
jgi:hypothetical protein